MGEKVTAVIENEGTNGANLPAKISFWSRVKDFWCSPIDWHKEIKLELTPGEEKFVQKMHDFWFQDVSFKGMKEFWCQPIDWNQEITLLRNKKAE